MQNSKRWYTWTNTKYLVLNKLRYREESNSFFSIHLGRTCFTFCSEKFAVEGNPSACRGEFLVSAPSFTNDDSIQRPRPSILLSGAVFSKTFCWAFMIRGPNKLLSTLLSLHSLPLSAPHRTSDSIRPLKSARSSEFAGGSDMRTTFPRFHDSSFAITGHVRGRKRYDARQSLEKEDEKILAPKLRRRTTQERPADSARFETSRREKPGSSSRPLSHPSSSRPCSLRYHCHSRIFW